MRINPKRLFLLPTVLLILTGSIVFLSASEPILLNEYNAVGGSKFLKDGKSDTTLGRVQGNGGNWIELVVTADHADIRGLQLRWAEEAGVLPAETLWDPDRPAFNQGTITFTDDPFWSDLREGTIITLSETEEIMNESDEVILKGSDLSFAPAKGDWWIHVWSFDSKLVETATNVDGDGPGNFSVGNDDWEITLVRLIEGEDPEVLWGPIGEAIPGFGGNLSSEEVGKLEFDPGTDISVFDFNDGSSSTFGLPNVWSAGTITQDFQPLREWAQSLQLLQVELIEGSVSVSFQRIPGRSYILQWSDDVNASTWESLTALPPVNAEEEYSENLGPILNPAERFFRLLITIE